MEKKLLSDIQDVRDRVGKRIRALHAFSGVPRGTEGVVEEYYTYENGHEGVMIRWNIRLQGIPLRDGFGKDGLRDESSLLEVIE